MMIKQILRLGWSICLCCLVFLNFNVLETKAEVNFHLPSVQPITINPDFISDSVRNVRDNFDYFLESGMADSAIQSASNGFSSGFGSAAGGIAGGVVTCYAANALILPVAPPVGAALAAYCPYIGGVAGSFSGVAASKKASEQVPAISKSLFKAIALNKNHKLLPIGF